MLLNEAMDFFRKHLNMHGKIVGLVRDEYLEVPAEALREAILNALCHRQYERYNLTIGIAIYDDRIEIENPGILPPQITPKNISMPHISYPYNPLIANVLYSATYIENWGSGIKRILDACLKRGVAAPTWTIHGGFVVVTFMRPAKDVTQSDTQGDTQNGTQETTGKSTLKSTLKGTKKKIVEIMANDSTVTIPQIAEQLKLHPRGIDKHIKQLQEQGFVRRIGGDKGGHWEIVNN